MVVEQLKQIDLDNNNRFELGEITNELNKPNGFFSNEDNLKKIGNLLNKIDKKEEKNKELKGEEELMKSMEDAFMTMYNEIIQKKEFNEEDKKILGVWKKMLGDRHNDELNRLRELEIRQDDEKNYLKNVDTFLKGIFGSEDGGTTEKDFENYIKDENKIKESINYLDNNFAECEHVLEKYKEQNIKDEKIGNGIEKYKNLLGIAVLDVLKEGGIPEKGLVNLYIKAFENLGIDKLDLGNNYTEDTLLQLYKLNKYGLLSDTDNSKIREKVSKWVDKMVENYNHRLSDGETIRFCETTIDIKLIQLYASINGDEKIDLTGVRGDIHDVSQGSGASTNETLTNMYINKLDTKRVNDLLEEVINCRDEILNRESEMDISDDEMREVEQLKAKLGEGYDGEFEEIDNAIDNELIKQGDLIINNELLKDITNYSNNLKELGIDIKERFLRKSVLNDIKTIEDINKINETNIKKYINIPDDVPSENYQYIVSNVKEILSRHLQLHPGRKSVYGLGNGLSTGMSIESTQQNDEELIKLYEQIKKLQTKNIDQQINTIVNGLPKNVRLFDLWLKATLNRNNQEQILKKIYDKIPLSEFSKLKQVSNSNSYINEIKNGYIIYQVQKNKWLKYYGEGDQKIAVLDFSKKTVFDKLYKAGCKDFDDLYNQTLECKPIITFYEQNENYKKKIKELEQKRDEELKRENDWYNKLGTYIVITETQDANMDHINRVKGIKNKYKKLIGEQCINIEIAYVKCLLAGKDKPTDKREGITGTGVMLDFSKGTDPNKIVRDSFGEKFHDQRDQFKYDLQNDKQAAFGSFVGMVGGIVGSAAVAIFTKNIWATSAGFTAGLRLGNGVGQELWNSGEWVYEKVSGNEIDSGNNKVTKFGTSFLRGVGAYDENYEYVGTAKFLSGLGFDYLSTVATFGLSKQFGGFLGKLEGIKFAGGALKFGMEELILENFFVDIPINIVQTGFETFTGIDNGVTIGNTAIGNQQTMEGQGYKSGSLSDALKAMKDATEQNISFENLSQTFFNTVIYGGLLEGGGAAIRKMKAYLPKGQVSTFEKSSAAAASAFLGLTNFMTTKKIEFNKDGKCIDSDTKKELVEGDSRLSELYNHLNAVSVTKTDVINSMETLFNTQKNMLADPESRTGLLFRLGLISDKNTPGNILKKKKGLIEKKLNEAKTKGDTKKIDKLQKILDIYTDAEKKLNNFENTKIDENNYLNGESDIFDVTESQARENSQIMDNILVEINEENKTQKLEELRQEINEQYKQVTGEELNLTDEQLLSVLDAHEQDGILGELTIGQLKQKVKVLSESISDSKVRRFLLEAGFCGKSEISEKLKIQSEIELSKFLDNNSDIKTKIQEGKFEFMGKSIEELYRRGLSVMLEGKSESQYESLILDFNTRFLNSLEFVSDHPNAVKFLDSKTGKLVEGTITDYGKKLFGENFESSPTKKAFFDKLKTSMFYQHLDNPLKYCSHGADHSILVDRYVQNIIESYPDVVNKVQEKYGINEEGARQLLRLTAVFHDFGYPDIGGLAKAMHGPFGGAHFINGYASTGNSTFIDFIEQDLGIKDEVKRDQLIKDMKDAIFFHSADKVEKGYLNRITYTKGSFLIGNDLSAKGTDDFIDILTRDSDGVMTITYRQGSEEGKINAENFKSKLLEKYPNLDGEKILIEEDIKKSYSYDEEFGSTTEYQGRKGKVGDTGIEFQPIDLLKDPLAGIVRLADNMDMSFDRLTKIQSHPIFMNLFYNIGYNHESINGHPTEQTTSYIYQQMEKLNKLDKKKQVSKEEYDSKSEKDKEDYITPEEYKEQYNEISTKIKALIEQANQNGGLEMTIFDEKTGRPKEGNSTFRIPFDKSILKVDGKVDLYTYKQFIIEEMAKHEDITSDSDVQIIQNIAIDDDISAYSFRHFIGLTPIKNVTIENNSETKRKTLVVKVNKDIYFEPSLRNQKISEGSFDNRPVVEYHIWRLFDASGRVTIDNGLLELKIIDETTNEILGTASRESATEKLDIHYNIKTPDSSTTIRAES